MSENFNASWAHVKGNTWCMLTENAYIPVYVLEDNRAIMLDSGWQDDLPDILQLLEEKNALLKKENYNNATAMQTLVLDERQRELAFEGKRWFDLVRKALRTTKENADGETVNDISATVDIIVAGKYLSNPKSYKNKFVSIDNFFFPIYERDINTYGGEHKGKLNQNPAYETESTTERN